MKFFNHHILHFFLTIVIYTIITYFVVLVLNKNGNNLPVLFFYLCSIVISAYRIGLKEPSFKKYLGLNYHFTIYTVYNGMPLLLAAMHLLPYKSIFFTLEVMAYWAALLVIHLAVWAVVKNKVKVNITPAPQRQNQVG